MESAEIVPATPQDLPVLLKFIRALAVYEKLEHQVIASVESLGATLFGKHPAAEVVFVQAQGSKLGFALFFTSYSTFLAKPGIYLEDLFVDPKERGKGYGKLLLQHLAQLAVERNCGRLEWSVLDWNEPALQFYRKVGALPMDQWTVQRLEGEGLMQFAQSAKN